MRIEIIPYQPFHLPQVKLAGALAEIRDRTVREGRAELLKGPSAWTALVDHRVAGCAGVFAEPDAPWRGIGWALVGEDVPRRAWPEITRTARAVLDRALFARIEINVARTFLGGLEWARRLGFEPEGIRTAWFEDGTDGIVFGRIRSLQSERASAVGVAAAREAVPT
jgi:hypothetical protein